MTVALVTASLTAQAAEELTRRYGWRLELRPSRSSIVDVEGLDRSRVEALIVEAESVDAATLDRFPALSLVACLRGTPVNVDVEAATARGIPVVYTPARNAEAAADFTLGLILSTLRHIAHTHEQIVSRKLTEARAHGGAPRRDVIWRPADLSAPVPYEVFKGPELAGLTVGLLGFGAIGRRVAVRTLALRMRVIAHDPLLADGEIAAAGATPAPLDRVLEGADVLSLHVPSQVGPPLVGERELQRLKPTAYLINTSRASALDYDALVDALIAGRLAGAGIDVYPDEPLRPDSPLLDLPNVTLTPHLAGASTNVVDRQSESLLESLDFLASGMAGAHVRNPEALAETPGGVPAAVRHTRPSASDDGSADP